MKRQNFGRRNSVSNLICFPKLALKASFLGVIISMKRSGALVLYGPSYLVVTLQKHEPVANMKPPLNYSVTVLKASKHQFMVSIT